MHYPGGRPHDNYRKLQRVIVVAIAGVMGVFATGGGAVLAMGATHAERVAHYVTHQACPSVTINHARCFARVTTHGAASPAVGADSSGFYGPVQFHTAYQLPCTPGGPVQAVCTTPSSYGPATVAIVDAGGYSSSSGTLQDDLQAYDSYYNLPACTAANGCLTVVNQSGATSPLPPNVSSGWSTEMAMDVQVAHLVCQTCKIVLVEANDDTIANIAAAEATAASYNPVAISNSWGSSTDTTAYDSYFKRKGVAVLAATGDAGTDTNGQSWPADIPEVVAVSGTTLQLNTNNTWASETLWSGSGGGCSVNYTAPSWQTSLPNWATSGCSNGGRAFGDIAADANPSTGAAVYINGAWYEVGGTSLATPLVAAMYALEGGMSSSVNAVGTLYKNYSSSVFHDITSGSDCTGSNQLNCTAGVGFDVPSGLGAPYGLGAFVAGPAAPSGLTASYVSQSQIKLSWTAVSTSNGVASYQLYRNGSLIYSGSSTSYNDTGLKANTSYSYYATTTDNSGNVSALSEGVTAGTFLPADINEDGHVNLLDFSVLASKYGQSGSSLGRSDINHDGTVNLLDFSLLASAYGTE